MDQTGNLVIDLTLDAAEFRNEIPRIKKMLSDTAADSERSAARVQRFLDRQKNAVRQVADSAASAASSVTSAGQKSTQAFAQMAQMAQYTQVRVADLSRKLREEQAQLAAVAQAQDRAAEAFYRQLDSVKQLKGGLLELSRIQSQVQRAKNGGDISQQDYLALISDVTAKKHLMVAADEQAAQSKTRFIQGLKQQVAAQSLSRAELLRVKAAELGAGSAAEVYIRKLEAAGTVTRALGLKSAMARREIGVLIGELARGNFGALRGSGITLANRAGWLEQLMSPKGLMVGGLVGGIAAAVYGLGKAWYEGEKEGEEFNKQLILTGNYAGKTSDQLNTMAKSLAVNGVTQHDAAGVLAQVVGSGSFRGGQIETVTRAAVAMQNATGEAVDKTIANFQKLYDSPTTASEELNKQLHYLTSSQYDYISSLEQRGFKEAAGEAAADAYSKAEQQRSRQVIDNIGLIERAIKSATNTWNRFWDAALNIGRKESNQTLLDTMQSTLAEIEANRKGGIWGWFKNNSMMVDEDRLREKIKNLQFVMKSQQGYDESQAEAKKADDDRTASLVYQNKILSENMSWQKKRAAALTTLWQNVARAPKDWSQPQREQAVAQINKNFSPPKTPKPPKTPTYHNDEAGRLLLQYSQQQAQVEGQITAAKQAGTSVTEKMTEAHKQLLALQQRIADLSGKKLTADEQSVLAHKNELEQALRHLDVSQQELQYQTALNELKKKTVQLTSQMAEEEKNVRQQHDLQLSTAGMGDKERQRYEERLKLQQHYQNLQEQLERDSKAKGTYGSAEYRDQEQTLQDSLSRRLSELDGFNTKVDAAQGNWKLGASRALSNFVDQGMNVAAMTENAFTGAFNGMADALGNFAVTGKLNFKSFASSVLADLAKMEARIAVSKALGMLMNFGISLFGGWDSTALHDGTHGIPMPPKLNALGGVYTSPDLSRYSGSVVNRPTFFAFARGAAVMGEAGPEAILPLRRTGNGKLGVVAAGTGGMAMFAPQYQIAINNTGPELGPQALKAVYDVGKKAASDFLQQQGRDGGRLSGAYR